MMEPFGFLGSISEYAFALVTQRQVDRGRNFFAHDCADLDLFANRFRTGGAKESMGERLILSQKAQQQMLRFYARAPELAALVTGKENHAASLLGVAFKH